jgi:tetratricopeptide (TPR) repeat protein/predicted Ser/Thr protein kinase
VESGDDPRDQRELDETVPLGGSGATPHGRADEPPTVTGRRSAATAPELASGDRIGRFVLLDQLGAGGMGVVFAARDTDLERKVAIKVLRRGGGQAAMRARLLREAQAIARLSHRNVVTVHEVGTIERGPAAGQVFLAMELIDGQTLTRWQREPHAWRDIVEVYLQAARGLAAAHAAGLVHRDFKPDNALLGRDGEVRVTDFGLASIGGEPEQAFGSSERSFDSPPASPRLTSTGDIMGTPLYMAPEQRAGRAVDARADQYAFCVALYRALHGVFPFGSDSEEALARRAAKLDLAPVNRKRRVPRAVQRILLRGLAPEPADRWPGMPALIDALSATLGARRRRVLAGGGVVLAGGAVAALLLAGGGDDGNGPRCDAGAAELATVWNDEARRLGAAGFAASGLPGGEAHWPRIAAAVDTWGAEWAAAHDDACRATRVERRAPAVVLAQRHACLAGQRDVLAGLIAVWAKADRELAARGVETALRLPRVADCAAPRALAGAEVQAGTAALRTKVNELRVATIAGRFAGELPGARDALGQARALGDRALEAEIGLLLGRLERQAAEPAARTTLFDAAAAAEAAGRDDLAVEAWSEWIYIAASVGVAEAEIEAASRRADAALRRAGDDRRLRGLLRNNQGVAAYEARRDRDAIKLFDEALAVRLELFGDSDPRIAEVLDNLGNAWGGIAGITEGEERKAARARALELAQRGLAIRLEALGETSAATARSLNNTATELDAAGRLDEAEAHFRRALAAKEATLGPDHPGIGTTLINLGDLLERRGRLDESLVMYQRCAKLWDRPEGAGVGSMCTPLNGMIGVLMALDRPAEAIAPAERCAALRAGEPPKARASLRAAAVARLEIGEVDAALTALRELVAADAEAYAADDKRRAPALIALSRAELAAGRTAQAAATLERAGRLVAADRDATPAIRAAILLGKAEITRSRAGAAAALAICDAEPGECGLALYGFQRRAARLQ